MSISIRQEDPAQPDIEILLRNGEAESARLYPAESNHHLPLEGLRAPEVCFLVGRDAAGVALVTGAYVRHGDWAEVKRMWVEEPARGRGLSRRMLQEILIRAAADGIAILRLETGVDSHAALALYAKLGFVERGPFGDYQPDPLSVFMERPL